MFLNDSTLNTSQEQAEIEVQENVKSYMDRILKKSKTMVIIVYQKCINNKFKSNRFSFVLYKNSTPQQLKN